MSEYVSKKALLEHIRREIGITERQRDAVMTRHMKEFHGGAIRALQNLEHAVQSSAFDADDSEVQRLRVGLIQALNQWEMYADMHRNVKGEHCIAESTDPDDLEALEFQRLWSLLENEALSTTTEPPQSHIITEIKDLLENWDFRAIASELESGYDQGVLLELVELCEKLTGAKSPRVNWLDQKDANAAKVKRVRDLWGHPMAAGAYRAGIRDTLSALGITIPGINAPEGDGNDA